MASRARAGNRGAEAALPTATEPTSRTPDLRIAKGSSEFLVEIKQVVGSLRFPEVAAFRVVEQALRGVRVRAIITFTDACVDGRASLKPLRKAVQEAARAVGDHVFDQGGVFAKFTVEPSDREFPAYTGAVCAGWVGDHEAVRAAIDEKLHKYAVPLVVALDMVECASPFATVDEVVYGREVVRIPISRETGGPAGPASPGRSSDGIVVRRDRDAERARERMEALLPFEWGMTDAGLRLSARVLANPFRTGHADLQVFAPIPRLLVTQAGSGRTLQLLGEPEPGSREESRWFHRPGFEGTAG